MDFGADVPKDEPNAYNTNFDNQPGIPFKERIVMNWRSPIFLVILIFFIILLLIGSAYFGLINHPSTYFTGETVALSFHVPREIEDKSVSQAIQEVIELNIKQDFWPEKYNIVKEESGLARLGLGRKYADNYKIDWYEGDTYFLVFVGYDKKNSDKLTGYVFNIYVKGINPTGVDMARTYLKDTPTQGWIHSEPKTHESFTSEISTIIWEEEQHKLYLEILSLAYKEPQPNYIPDETVKDITIMRFLIYTPNNPQFDMIKEFQHSAHSLYGQ